MLMETEPFSDPPGEVFEAAGYQCSTRACVAHGSNQSFRAGRQGYPFSPDLLYGLLRKAGEQSNPLSDRVFEVDDSVHRLFGDG